MSPLESLRAHPLLSTTISISSTLLFLLLQSLLTNFFLFRFLLLILFLLIVSYSVFCLIRDYHRLDFNENLVRGKRVLITGASRGIGRHVALNYAKYGSRIVITARDEEALKIVKQECEEAVAVASTSTSSTSSAAVSYVVASQGSMEEAQSLVDSAADLLGGGIDTLFLVHGLSSQAMWEGNCDQMTAASAAIQVNYLSLIYLVSAAKPYLAASDSRSIGGSGGSSSSGGDSSSGGCNSSGSGSSSVGGSVVVVNSASARSPIPSFTYYGASKAAMAAFFRCLDLEWKMTGVNITVTVCTLGLVKTERNIRKETSSLAFRLGVEPEDAALFMIQTAALRIREAKFPLIQFLVKDFIDSLPAKLKALAMKRAAPKAHQQ